MLVPELLTLKHHGGGVVVEGDCGHHHILLPLAQLLVHKDSLTTASPTHQQHWAAVGHEEVQEVAKAHCLSSVDKDSL